MFAKLQSIHRSLLFKALPLLSFNSNRKSLKYLKCVPSSFMFCSLIVMFTLPEICVTFLFACRTILIYSHVIVVFKFQGFSCKQAFPCCLKSLPGIYDSISKSLQRTLYARNMTVSSKTSKFL